MHMHPARVALVVLLALLAASCAPPPLRPRLRLIPRCADGLPPKILTDPACPPDSICGYSCLPGRWLPPPDPSAAVPTESES